MLYYCHSCQDIVDILGQQTVEPILLDTMNIENYLSKDSHDQHHNSLDHHGLQDHFHFEYIFL